MVWTWVTGLYPYVGWSQDRSRPLWLTADASLGALELSGGRHAAESSKTQLWSVAAGEIRAERRAGKALRGQKDRVEAENLPLQGSGTVSHARPR